jgi:2-oxoacid:acceptor oxidoreductase gamma subunit (pyruvate/2-ketoisovalerate family)
MKEIRIHGRSGAATIMAAHVLEQAALRSGYFAQAVASSGRESEARATAVVRIYEIGIQSQVEAPDPIFVLVQDHTLLHSLGVADDLPAHTRVLVNWSEVAAPTVLKSGRIVVMPATCMAEELTGGPISSIALLAALITLTELMPLAALQEAIAMHFRGEELQRNLSLAAIVARMVPAALWKESAGVGDESNASIHSVLH